MVMELPTIANFAEAFAVIVAVVFGTVQLHQLNSQRRREAAFTLMQSIQSPRMLHGIFIIDRLQERRLSTPTFSIENGRGRRELERQGLRPFSNT